MTNQTAALTSVIVFGFAPLFDQTILLDRNYRDFKPSSVFEEKYHMDYGVVEPMSGTTFMEAASNVVRHLISNSKDVEPDIAEIIARRYRDL